jgi:integrase
LTPENPAALLHRIKPEAALPHPIPEHALARAFALADEETGLMLALGAYAGCRRSEMAAMHSSWVQPMGLMILGKGGKTRRVPIHPLLAPRLARVDGWAFPSPRLPGRHVGPSYIEDRLAAVLPASFTPHSLRHRFATATYAACRDITVVQRLLGHQNVATTMRYTQLVDDDLDAAVRAVS